MYCNICFGLSCLSCTIEIYRDLWDGSRRGRTDIFRLKRFKIELVHYPPRAVHRGPPRSLLPTDYINQPPEFIGYSLFLNIL